MKYTQLAERILSTVDKGLKKWRSTITHLP